MVGRDMLPLAQGRDVAWRDARYKFIRYHGVWDVDELFDLETDPGEMRNLIDDPAHVARARAMSARMYAVLAETQGLSIPLWPDRGGQQHRAVPAPQAPPIFPPRSSLGPGRLPSAIRVLDRPGYLRYLDSE